MGRRITMHRGYNGARRFLHLPGPLVYTVSTIRVYFGRILARRGAPLDQRGSVRDVGVFAGYERCGRVAGARRTTHTGDRTGAGTSCGTCCWKTSRERSWPSSWWRLADWTRCRRFSTNTASAAAPTQHPHKSLFITVSLSWPRQAVSVI